MHHVKINHFYEFSYTLQILTTSIITILLLMATSITYVINRL